MEITYLFLALLFVVGLLNIYFQAPSKKFSAWLQSFAVKNSVLATASSEAAETKELVSNKERSCGGIVAAGSRKVELKRVFATFDKNGDGFITKQEMKESLKNIRVIVSDKEIEEMVVKVDSNGDGLIDLEEFCILCESIGVQETTNLTSSGKGKEVEEVNIVEEGDGEGDLMEAFNVFDKDEDGLISVEELGSVLCSLGLKEGKKVEDCKEMIRKVDMDGDGMVNFDEFKRMMRGEGKLVSAF